MKKENLEGGGIFGKQCLRNKIGRLKISIGGFSYEKPI